MMDMNIKKVVIDVFKRHDGELRKGGGVGQGEATFFYHSYLANTSNLSTASASEDNASSAFL